MHKKGCLKQFYLWCEEEEQIAKTSDTHNRFLQEFKTLRWCHNNYLSKCLNGLKMDCINVSPSLLYIGEADRSKPMSEEFNSKLPIVVANCSAAAAVV